MATLPSGVPLRLTGLDWLSGDLKEGDVVSMRVMSDGPVLELEMVSTSRYSAAKKGPLDLSDYPAMRLNFAELKNLAWRAPNPVELAAAWQGLAQAGWSQPTVAGPDRWLLPVYGWSGGQAGGLRMNLRLVRREKDPRSARRKRGPLALRVELKHPTLGPMAFDVEWHSGGIQLSFAVEESAGAQVVRDNLSSFVAALSRANLRLVGVRLATGIAAVMRVRVPPASLLPAGITDDTLPPSLFRAAAETAVALLKLTERQQ